MAEWDTGLCRGKACLFSSILHFLCSLMLIQRNMICSFKIVKKHPGTKIQRKMIGIKFFKKLKCQYNYP